MSGAPVMAHHRMVRGQAPITWEYGMTGAGAVTVSGAPQPLNVTVFVSLPVVMVSLSGSTRGAAESVSRTLMTAPAVPDAAARVVQSRMYAFCPPIVALRSRAASAAEGRMPDGRAARVSSAARAWYSLVP